jgi:hypothetical protein
MMSAGEFLGFAVPAVVGGASYAAGVPAVPFLLLMVGAGAVEGAVLGSAQWQAMRSEFLAMPQLAWVRATAVGAAIAWAFGMSPSTFFVDGPLAVFVAFQIVGVLGVMLSIAIAQWWVLREHLDGAGWWIPATTLAWTVGIIWVFMAMSVPAEGETALMMVLAVASGLLMGLTAAAISGAALVLMLRRRADQSPPVTAQAMMAGR